MTSALRFVTSAVLGAVLALSLLAVSSFVAPAIAGAQEFEPLSASELFGGDGEDFGARAGLGTTDLSATIGNLIRIALGFLGVIAIIITLMGGFKWMTAGGNDEKVGEAKRMLISGAIGLAIIISAYAITEFVIDSLLDAANNI